MQNAIIHLWFVFLHLVTLPALCAAGMHFSHVSVVNAARVDFDGAIEWGALLPGASVHHDAVGTDPSDADLLARCPSGCEVLVTKEIPIRASFVASLPASVKLICEAGTGFNNIDREGRTLRTTTFPPHNPRTPASLRTTHSAMCSLCHPWHTSCERSVVQRERRCKPRRHFPPELLVRLDRPTTAFVGGPLSSVSRGFCFLILICTPA